MPESPSNASTTSNGDAVRASGITAPGSSASSPCGSSARYFEPSSVLISIEAEVRSPTQASVTVNVTSTRSPASSTSLDLPTLTPAMVTWSPDVSPAASLNSAL